MSPIHTVLCALDFSGASRSALREAADLAERSHASLHLLHVNPLFRARLAYTAGSEHEGGFSDRVHAFVDDVLGAADAFEVLGPVVHESRGQTPADGVLHYADSVGADLIVMGTHGRHGLEHILLGSVAAETLRRSTVPVLVVPERAERTEPGPHSPVLVGVDFSDHSGPSLASAQSLAGAYMAPLAVAHVRDVPPDTVFGTPENHPRPLSPSRGLVSREAAHEALDALLGTAGVAGRPIEQHVVPGRPAHELAGLARRTRAGLLVVGTHGRRGWDRLRLGSVAEEVVREAPCPVLVVPTPTARTVGEGVATEAASSTP